jgi:6-pyruvoyltetrahydropterin/6-carboxytetrahydropterin synthase
MPYQLIRRFKFDAAHHLTDYDGACANVHGHTYQVEYTVQRPERDLRPSGPPMVEDFARLKAAEQIVRELLDHTDLNKALNYSAPTAEFIATWIHQQLQHRLPHLRCLRVDVWETENSCATYMLEE